MSTPSDALVKVGSQALATRFSGYRRLTVRQRKKWLEILLSFEMKNAYDVYDEQQMPVLRVQELGAGLGSFLTRIFLGRLRPFGARVSDLGTGETVLQLKRPFRFIFHRLEIHDSDGALLGAIERRWTWFTRRYEIEDASGQVIAELFGPFFRPWTFELRAGGRAVGAIRKRWSGFAKEMFTDADNFGVELGAIEDPHLRALAFAATVLVDVVHFERSKG